MISRLLLLLLAGTVSSLAAESSKLSETQNLEWLRELKPLPKVHYSWPLPLGKVSDEVLHEYARLTHAISVSGEWCKPEQIDHAVQICQRVNLTKPRVPVSIGINFSVWHRRFGKELPPTDVGPTHVAELDYLKTRMEWIRDRLAGANKTNDASVKISAALLDSEHFHTKPDDAVWNQAITDKYNAAYDTIRAIFPGIRIEWYARGAVHMGASPTGWNKASYFALDEKGDSFGCSLYQVPEIGNTREIFRRTARNAKAHGIAEVTPWISLASGYRRKAEKYHDFEMEWNYDLIYSWKLGTEINNPWYGVPERAERFAPWHMAKVAVFYPEPFGRSTYWADHFIAYVRGANGVKKLPIRDGITE
jgi:hypothetical protein